MKKILSYVLVLCFVAIGVGHSRWTTKEIYAEDYFTESYFDASCNMRGSLDDIKQYLIDKYSPRNGYAKAATVTVVYDSNKITCENLSQTTLNDQWNRRNPAKKINGTCRIVALTMLLRKYMDQNLLEKESNESIFNRLVAYALDKGYLESNGKGGLSSSEIKDIAKYYLCTRQKNKYKANVDYVNLWNTTKKYLDDKFKPVEMGLNGSGKTGHDVLITGSYILRIRYATEKKGGRTKYHTKDYKVLRVCNGWDNSWENNRWSSIKTNKYVFFDCANDLLKLK